MKRESWRWVLLGACVVAILIGPLMPDERVVRSRTTRGKVPTAYGGLFDLFSELGLEARRSYALPEGLPPGATVWWIEPLAFPRIGQPAATALVEFATVDITIA